MQKHYRTQDNLNPNGGEVNLWQVYKDDGLANPKESGRNLEEPDTIDRLQKGRRSYNEDGNPTAEKSRRAKTKIAFRGFNDSNLLIAGDFDERELARQPIEKLFSRVRVTRHRSLCRKSQP